MPSTTVSPAARRELLSLYRSFIRHLPPQHSLHPAAPRSPLYTRLRQTFEQGLQPTTSSLQFPGSQVPSTTESTTSSGGDASKTTPAPQADVVAMIHQARQYLAYLDAQRTYVSLLERYNPGMHMDTEERVRLTARRVGLNLPIEFRGDEQGSGSGEG